MAATVLAMSVESSVLEQAWNCLNADEAGQRAIVIPRSVATRDLLFVGRDEQERARAARATPNRTGSASSVSEKQIPRFARDDIFVALCPRCVGAVSGLVRVQTVDACLATERSPPHPEIPRRTWK